MKKRYRIKNRHAGYLISLLSTYVTTSHLEIAGLFDFDDAVTFIENRPIETMANWVIEPVEVES